MLWLHANQTLCILEGVQQVIVDYQIRFSNHHLVGSPIQDQQPESLQ